MVLISGCGTDSGDGSASGGAAPSIVDMQAVDGNGTPRSGFTRGSQLRLMLTIDDSDENVAGVWISFYPGNDTIPFFGPESHSLELVSEENATYLTSPVLIPLDLPTGRYRVTAEVYDGTDLFSLAVYVWIDIV